MSTFDAIPVGSLSSRDHHSIISVDFNVIKEGYLIKKQTKNKNGAPGRWHSGRDETVYMVLSSDELKIFRSKLDFEDKRGLIFKSSLE